MVDHINIVESDGQVVGWWLVSVPLLKMIPIKTQSPISDPLPAPLSCCLSQVRHSDITDTADPFSAGVSHSLQWFDHREWLFERTAILRVVPS